MIEAKFETVYSEPILEKVSSYLKAPSEGVDRIPGERNLFQRLLFRLLTSLLRVLVTVEGEGAENLPPDGRVVICSNHCSHLDAFVIALHLPPKQRYRMSSFAKRAYFGSRPIGFFSKLVGSILIGGAGSFRSSIQQGSRILQLGRPLLVFPEGTRSRNGVMGRFQRGAALFSLLNSAPIVPVGVSGSYEIWPPSRALPRFLSLVFGPRRTIKVSFGPPIYSYHNGVNVDELTALVRSEVSQLLTPF